MAIFDFLKRRLQARPTNPAPSKPPRFPITREQIAFQVHVFYVYAQDDPVLSEVLNKYIDDWLKHERKLSAFWRKVILHEPGFEGNIQRVHQPVAEMSPEMFERWLELFEDAAHEVLPDETAIQWVALARNIAAGMQAGVADAQPAHAQLRSDIISVS